MCITFIFINVYFYKWTSNYFLGNYIRFCFIFIQHLFCIGTSLARSDFYICVCA